MPASMVFAESSSYPGGAGVAKGEDFHVDEAEIGHGLVEQVGVHRQLLAHAGGQFYADDLGGEVRGVRVGGGWGELRGSNV